MKHANRTRVPERQVQRAKLMRVTMTEPERKLWRAMRQRIPMQRSHFRRQVPIGPYIVDVCRLGERLVVEVDGNQHGSDEARQYDAVRTQFIASHGFRVLRFANEDVTLALESVLDAIAAAIDTTLGLSQRPAEEIRSHG